MTWDDDQAFVKDVVDFIKENDIVDYRTVQVDKYDDGRDAEISLSLYAGDKYVITIREVH